MKRRLWLATIGITAMMVASLGDPAFGAPGFPPSRSSLQMPALATVSGKVVDADSSKAVPSARVTLTGAGIARETTVGPGGDFKIAGLSAGAYSVVVRREGYVPGGYGQQWPEGPTAQLTVPTKTSELVEIRLWRLAAVEGTLADDHGGPMAGVEVDALRRTWVGGRTTLVKTGSDVTDDRGIYRIVGLQPADYVIGVRSVRVTYPAGVPLETLAQFPGGIVTKGDAVIQQSNGLPLLSEASDSAGGLTVFPTVLFPQAQTPGQAGIVTLHSGEQQVVGVIAVSPVMGRLVSGRALRSDGSPASGAHVVLVPKQLDTLATDNGFEVARTTTDGEGRFWLYGAPAGSYTLRVVKVPLARNPSLAMKAESAILYARHGDQLPASTSRLPPPEAPTLWTEVDVNVAGQPVDVNVVMSHAARLSGQIQFRSQNSARAEDRFQPMRIVLEPAATPSNGELLPDRIASDGRFVTTGAPPGKYFIRITGEPKEWTLRSILIGGEDYVDLPFDLDTTDISSVVVVMVDEPATQVRGRVVGTAANSAGVTVIAFPTIPDQWEYFGTAPRRLRAATASGDGVYAISGLPPGEYFLAAISGEGSRDWQRRAFLEKTAVGTAKVTLRAGEVATMDLRAVRVVK